MKRKSGLNMEGIRNSNKMAILSYLFSNGPSSRKQIAQALNLTTATLTIITNELINEGLIQEIGEIIEKKAGRKQILIDLKANAKFSIGLEVHNKKILFTLTNLKAQIILENEWDINIENSQFILGRIVEYLKNIVLTYNNRVLGIGILVLGKIENNIAADSIFPNIYYLLKENLNINCIIENNITGLVKSELFSKKNSDNFWLLKYGPGLGSAVIINNTLLKYSSEKLIEIGHISISETRYNKLCPICHQKHCLESELHFYNLIEEIPQFKEHNYDEKEIFKLITLNPTSEKLLTDNLKILAKYFSIAFSIIPTSKIILCGEIFESKKYFSIFLNYLSQNNHQFLSIDISCINNHDYKRKIAGSILILDNFFNSVI